MHNAVQMKWQETFADRFTVLVCFSDIISSKLLLELTESTAYCLKKGGGGHKTLSTAPQKQLFFQKQAREWHSIHSHIKYKRLAHFSLFLWRGILFWHYLQLGGEVFYIFLKEQMKINEKNVSLHSFCMLNTIWTNSQVCSRLSC